ncbi:hypothetical protein EsDP_00006592 [Epichloe bromicola]|uniref:Uncharacterized protein n=1 Tax=Epichloe bromicola TaxID=79588 RepID=A0ABQ0CY35_9HYPO
MSQNLNSLHMQADDVPPPPYSETDIYSNSGGPRSPNTTTSPDTASRVSSSTGGDVVYTPPLTPQTSLNTHVQASRQQPLPTTQPGATMYFESRPPPAAAPGLQRDVVVYSVKVEGTSSPDDFPYQNDWAARDVTSQDWATFVNFLLPDHATRGNEAVIERKLRAEARSDASPTSGCFQVGAQLEQVRENQPSTTGTKREIEATIQQWNDGFFGPRGMKLKLDQETGALAPGGWEAEREDGGDRARQQQQREACATTFGKFSIDSGGIRYGDSVVWDRNGIQFNGLKLGSNGISRARGGCSSGRRDGPGDGNAGPSRQAGPEQSTSRDNLHGPPSGPSWSFGGGSGWHRDRNGQRSDRCDVHHEHHDRHDRHDRERHGRRGHRGRRSADGGRGRHSRRDEKHNRNRSSSESSVSSVDSSSSESSVGSLPSYDDIEDHQLPLYTERLRDWTSNPDQMRTKSDMKALRADLQSTRSMPEDAHSDQSVDRKALRAQIKRLHAQWKSIKKAQRQTRRRERRQRRAERREQRHQRREMRRAKRDSTQGLRGPFGTPVPSVPAVPPVPSATCTPSAPPAPPAPTAALAPPPWSQGFVRGCNGPSRRSPFFFVPDGPLGERGPLGSHGPLGNMDGPLARHGPLGEHGPLGPHGPFGPGGFSWGSRGRGRGGPSGGGGASFGAGRGRGNPRDRAPGAWPEDDGQEAGITAPPPGTASTAKHKAAEQIEAEVSKMVSQAAGLGDGVERRALEKAIEALTNNLDMLRMEADEAYARELAASEAGY